MELVRCRMCNGQGGVAGDQDEGIYMCFCDKCELQTEFLGTKEEAIRFWNELMGVTLDELEHLMDQPLFGVKLGSYKIEEIVAHKEVLIKARNMEG